LYVAASDHRVLSPFERAKRLSNLGRDVKPKESGVLSLAEQEFGAVKAGPAYWSSSISILDLRLEGSPFSTIDLEDNEAALCIAVVRFAKDSTQPKAVINGNGLAHSLDEGTPFSLVVGSTKSSTVIPRASQANYLTVYTLSEDGRHMHLLHKTEVDEIISAIQPFQGKLLVGAGKALRLYDMGRKKLLRKCEVKIPSVVTSIRTQGTRIVVADAQESTFFVTYKARENRMLVFADDTLPRWSLSACMLDYDTVCAGDKFGNVFVNRLDAEVSRIVDEDVSGTTIMQEKGYLQGAPHKLALEAHFHVGDVITSLNKVSLVPGGRPIIMYTGLSGTIGCLIALTSKEDVNMLNTLEMHLRQEQQTPSSIVNMVGRDHLAFRGSYHPVKDVIDGDLCELFALLPLQRQLHIAEELDRTPAEINKKLESLRATNAF
jgi:splicing factor 3B subunit 3